MISFSELTDAAAFARRCLGFTPLPDQLTLLTTRHRYVLLNCHRQWGKTTLTAIRALHRAVHHPAQTIVILSPTLRQSRLLANRCREFASRLSLTLRTDGTNPRSLLLPNGSLILPLPAHPDRVRGFSAHLLIIDEAARVPDEVYAAATPMLAATRGDLRLLSTPHGPSGFFYQEWIAPPGTGHPWLRLETPISGPHRLDPQFLDAERARKTGEQFAQEYECRFLTPGRNVFSEEWLERAFSADVAPFDPTSREDLRFARHRPVYFASLDVAKTRDHAASILLEYRVTPSGRRDPATYQMLYRRELRVVLAEQFRQRTAYRDIIAHLSRLCHHPHLHGHTQLLLDATGKGEPVEEMFRDAKLPVTLIPICITSGSKVTVAGNWRMVPKVDLVTNLEFLLERGLLKISHSMPHSDLLRHELRHFERRSTPGGAITYGAGTGHDDLVMALSLAAWWAWRNRKSSLSGPELKPLD